MSNEEECDCPPEGLPAYMGTFADLMALLMCFFVLLLSFSEMDVLKFKQIAGSMKFAFGVQNKVDVKDIPKGTSIIAREFSPGKPKPTVIEAIMQQTIDITKETLEFDEPSDEDSNEGAGEKSNKGKGTQTQDATNNESQTQSDSTNETSEERAARLAKAQAEAEALAKSIANDLQQEIIDGQVELLAKGAYVVIRIREKGSFASASDTIESEFIPVIRKIETILSDTKGEIRVAGHTDNLPIDNEYFRSNWELSGGRAGSVTRELLRSGLLDKGRFVITGYADTKPIADNNTAEGRATNRRVEIIIVQGEQPTGEIVGVGLDTPQE
ncbi:flagellar motor protein MotB [Aliikangiella sp. IMCC44359]|uniref:flagellar motor protein MotB n=1 Tax=Aliikangiella sp. IMCC44359 TaxID=3459125 RepID=UPI00403A9D75